MIDLVVRAFSGGMILLSFLLGLRVTGFCPLAIFQKLGLAPGAVFS